MRGVRGFHLTRLLGCCGHTWCDLLKQVDNELITVMQMERRSSHSPCLCFCLMSFAYLKKATDNLGFVADRIPLGRECAGPLKTSTP